MSGENQVGSLRSMISMLENSFEKEKDHLRTKLDHKDRILKDLLIDIHSLISHCKFLEKTVEEYHLPRILVAFDNIEDEESHVLHKTLFCQHNQYSVFGIDLGRNYRISVYSEGTRMDDFQTCIYYVSQKKITNSSLFETIRSRFDHPICVKGISSTRKVEETQETNVFVGLKQDKGSIRVSFHEVIEFRISSDGRLSEDDSNISSTKILSSQLPSPPSPAFVHMKEIYRKYQMNCKD